MSGAVPQLRFPDFDGEWEELPLEQLCSLRSGKFIPAAEITPEHKTGLYPCYGGNGVRGYVRDYNTDGTFPLIGRQGALCGNVQLASGQFYSTEHALVANPKVGVDVNWLYQQLLRMNLNQHSTGLAQPGLSVDVLNAVMAARPESEAEQQKIADFLGAVDAKLDALRRKKSGLEAFKSGLMQRLFSQEIRFTQEDGTDFPDWDQTLFGEIAERSPDKFDPRDVHEGMPVIDLENIESGTGRIIRAGQSDKSGSLKSVFRSGEVLFGKLRPYLRKYAQPGFDGCCSSEIWVLRGKGVSNDFLFYLIQSSRFMELATISSGSKMPRADWSIMSSAEFEIPHPHEQRKIADALSAMDAKIAAVADQITHMETFKKGLLQQMFV